MFRGQLSSHAPSRTATLGRCFLNFVLFRRRIIFGVLIANLLFFVVMYISVSSAEKHERDTRTHHGPPKKRRAPIYLDIEPPNPRSAKSRSRDRLRHDMDPNDFDPDPDTNELPRHPDIPINPGIYEGQNYARDIMANREDSKSCTDLVRPFIDLTHKYRWYTVAMAESRDDRDDHNDRTVVFSAYLDPRTHPNQIKVIGASSSYSMRYYCQIWYKDRDEPHIVRADFNIVPETHDYRFAPCFFTCSSLNRLIPYAVSVTSSKCEHPAHFLPVILPRDQTQKNKFTVCVSPLNFHYDDVFSFTETIEMNRILGADKIVLYNHTVGVRVGTYIKNYVSEGLVDVIPWRIPLEVHVQPPNPLVNPEIHYFGQVVALNDCLYRYMFRSRYIIFTDLDELLIPRLNLTWNDMMVNLTSSDERNYGAYLFRNTFFRIDWDDDTVYEHSLDKSYQLRTQLKLNRESHIWDFYSRTKMLVVPKAVDMVGIHFVFSFAARGMAERHVSSDVALLHHYRDWGDPPGHKPENELDPYMRNYTQKLYQRVSKTHKLNGIVRLKGPTIRPD